MTRWSAMVSTRYVGRPHHRQRCTERRSSYQREEYKKSGDVAEHAAERDLERTENLERRHEVRRPRDAQNVGDGEEDVGHDLRIVRLPVDAHCGQQT